MNNKAKITWYIQEGDDFIQDNEAYLGSYSSEDEIILNTQVWNNRYGKNNVESIPNARLAIFFDSIEDNVLLNYCYVSVNENGYEKVPIIFNKGIVDIGLLSGSSNNGLDIVDNMYNFKNLSIRFKGFPYNLKNGIKNMYLDIEVD